MLIRAPTWEDSKGWQLITVYWSSYLQILNDVHLHRVEQPLEPETMQKSDQTEIDIGTRAHMLPIFSGA